MGLNQTVGCFGVYADKPIHDGWRMIRLPNLAPASPYPVSVHGILTRDLPSSSAMYGPVAIGIAAYAEDDMAQVRGEHHYAADVEWTGNQGTGTSGYRVYGRDHSITAGTKPVILGSSDPAFRGDAARWNPEDLLVAALSTCLQL